MRPKRKWSGTVVSTTGDSFQAVKLLVGGSTSYNDLVKWDRNTAIVRPGLLPREEILLRTNAHDAPISLRISAAKRFRVVVGTADPVKRKKFAADFDPASHRTKPSLPSDVDKPTFFVWYEAELASGTRAPGLTQEEIDALNALGYGRDISFGPANSPAQSR
jgi:hypothetical protein